MNGEYEGNPLIKKHERSANSYYALSILTNPNIKIKPAYSVWVHTAPNVAVYTQLKAGRGKLSPAPPRGRWERKY